MKEIIFSFKKRNRKVRKDYISITIIQHIGGVLYSAYNDVVFSCHLLILLLLQMSKNRTTKKYYVYRKKARNLFLRDNFMILRPTMCDVLANDAFNKCVFAFFSANSILLCREKKIVVYIS